MRDRATQAETALTDAQTKVQRLGEEAEGAKQGKAQAEQQVGELKAVEGQLEVEVARLQNQLVGVQGQLHIPATSVKFGGDWPLYSYPVHKHISSIPANAFC